MLINIARGTIVDSKALIDNVDKLGRAVLDVLEEERWIWRTHCGISQMLLLHLIIVFWVMVIQNGW